MRTRALLIFALIIGGCGSAPDIARPGAGSPGVVRGADVTGGQTGSLQIEVGRATNVEESLPAKLELTWPALIEAYREAGLVVTAIDERTRTIATRGQRVTRRLGRDRLSTFFDCGTNMTGVVADLYHLELSVTTTLLPSATGGSTLRTAASARGFNPQGSATNAVPCGSNGTLEARIAGLVRVNSTVY